MKEVKRSSFGFSTDALRSLVNPTGLPDEVTYLRLVIPR